MDADTVRRYRISLAGELRRLKFYPASARQSGEEGVAEIGILLGAGGKLKVDLLLSSGSEALDKAALEMVREAAGRVPPPMGGWQAGVRLSVPVRFALAD